VILVNVSGVFVGLLGVDKIINFALPLFLGLYPVSILLVFLGLFRKYIPNAGAYKGSVILTVLISSFETLAAFGINIQVANNLISMIPLSAFGFAWLLPAVVGFIGGALIHKAIYKNEDYDLDLKVVNEHE
jgi:LIVCS family branched-chain amino acid:cation transporter